MWAVQLAFSPTAKESFRAYRAQTVVTASQKRRGDG